MKKKLIVLIVLILGMHSLSVTTNAYSNSKWGEGFYTESYIYLQDSLPYMLFKESYNVELGLKITDCNGTELTETDNIYTGAELRTLTDNKKIYTYVILGDVDKNGIVSAADARFVLRLSAGMEIVDNFIIYLAADINNSYEIDASDARSVLRYAAAIDGVDRYAKFSSKKLVNYDYLDEAYVSVVVDDSVFDISSVLKNELVEKIYEIDNGDSKSSYYILKLKSPGRDNVDKIIYHLYNKKGVIVYPPNRTDFS